MYKKLLLGSGSVAALTIAASFFGATGVLAATCSATGVVASGAVIDCPVNSVTNSGTGTVIDGTNADHVALTLENGAQVSNATTAMTPNPATVIVRNNGSLTLNSGAVLSNTYVNGGKTGYGTAFQAGSGLQALILSGSTVDGEITAGAGSHITVAGTMASGFLSTNIALTGDNNTVTLDPSYSLSGSTIGGDSTGATNNTLELGGSGTASFNASVIGSPFGFANFEKFAKSGDSSWTLTGTPVSTTTPWTISGGTLILSSNTTLGSTTVTGGTVTGAGHTGALTVTGGSVTPGTGSTGTLTAASLSLSSGATTVIGISPTTNATLAVTGAATLDGGLITSADTGSYALGQRYTVLTATGGLSGTYAYANGVNLPSTLRPSLSYDANDVYVTLIRNALTPLLPSGTSGNALAVAGAIDKTLAGGATLSPQFAALFNSSGTDLSAKLNQLSGEISGDASQAASQSFAPFLEYLTGSGISGGDQQTGAADPLPGVHPAQATSGAMRVWAAGYGGMANFGAQPVSGAAKLNSNQAGLMAGVEDKIDSTLVGLSIGVGRNNFSIARGQSDGSSTDVTLGGYFRTPILDAGYVSGALGYAWHAITTDRIVTVGPTEDLRGKFIGRDLGARAEAGYNLALDDGYGLTPYAAVAGNSFEAPAYSETALAGPSTFALTYAAKTNGMLHSELGARLGHDWLTDSDTLTTELHAAWAHQFVDQSTAAPTFQDLPGASFGVAGAKLPQESADIGASLQVTGDSGITGGARVEGQFGDRFTAVSAMVNLGYRW